MNGEVAPSSTEAISAVDSRDDSTVDPEAADDGPQTHWTVDRLEDGRRITFYGTS